MTTAPLTFHKHAVSVTTWHRDWVKGQIDLKHSVPCGDCSACCRAFEYIPLQPAFDDVSTYRTRLDKDGDPILEQHPDGSCIYLVDNRCSIYDRRPVTCRTFDCRTYLLIEPITESVQAAGLPVNPLIPTLQKVAHERFDLTDKSPADRAFRVDFLEAISEVYYRTARQKPDLQSLIGSTLLLLAPPQFIRRLGDLYKRHRRGQKLALTQA